MGSLEIVTAVIIAAAIVAAAVVAGGSRRPDRGRRPGRGRRSEGYYWGVSSERENCCGPEGFSPDQPGTCPQKHNVAAQVESDALRVLAGY